MQRCAAGLLLAASVTASEAKRSDLHLWFDAEPTEIDYRISAPTEAQRSGSDGFDRAVAVRLGTRWTWSSPGASWAPQYGADLVVGDASGETLSAGWYGLALAGGVVWTQADAWQFEAEAHVGAGQMDADAPEQLVAPAFALSGSTTSIGLRAVAAWLFARHWAVGAGVGVGWMSESADLSGDTVDLAMGPAGAGRVRGSHLAHLNAPHRIGMIR